MFLGGPEIPTMGSGPSGPRNASTLLPEASVCLNSRALEGG